MTQAIYQGRTQNHINWVMVDATDFATPESALSAATKIKIYGQLRSATGTNFVSSGTGSLTNDITHVGASALGIYHIALAKADISDASAAFYDVYVVSLSATGAAFQTLVLQGIRADDSYVSNILSYLSNMASNLSGVVSDTYSALVALSDAVSNAYSAAVVGSSRILLVQSRLSDLDSRLLSDVSDLLSAVRGNSDALSDLLSRVNSASFLSDIASHVWAAKYTANSAASSFGSLMSDIYSRAGGAVTASDISDIASAVWATALATKLVQLNTSDLSDLRSAISAGPTGGVTVSDISDIASAVWAAKYTAHSAASSFGSLFSDVYSRVLLIQSVASDAASAAAQANSRVLLVQSTASDAASGVTVLLARVPSTLISNINSMLVAGTFALGASNLSDIESRVWSADKSDYNASSQMGSLLNAAGGGADAATIAARVWSDYQSKVGQTPSQVYSNISNMLSYISGVVSDFQSDFQSRVPKAVATSSQLSDLHSDLRSFLVGVSGAVSDLQSAVSDFHSDFQSRVPGAFAFTVAGLVDANVLRLNGVAASAQNLERSASVIHQGSVTGATTTTTLIDSGLTEADTDFWKGRIIIFTSGALLGQATDITAFDPALDKLTFTALTAAPAAAVTYVIV